MLCTLEDVKSWLSITDNSKDAILTMIANAQSKAIENYCNTKLETSIITDELYEGSGNNNSIVLNNMNVQSIEKLEFLINDVWEEIYNPSTPLDTYNLTLDKENGIIKIDNFVPSKTAFDLLTSNPITPVNSKTVRISYTCGFETIPSDLAYVCIKMSARAYKREFGAELLVKSEEVIKSKVSYETNLSNSDSIFIAEEKQILDNYKKWL